MPPGLETWLAKSPQSTISKKQPPQPLVPMIDSPPVKNVPGKSKARTYGDEPLPFGPSETAPRKSRIIGRVAEDGEIPMYKLEVGVGKDVVDNVPLFEVLDYVSAFELEQYENRQFEEERAALAIAKQARKGEEGEERLYQRRKANAKARGTLITEEVVSEGESEADVATGRHGRARPTYKHLFKPVLEKQRRRRRRDPNTGELLPLSDDDDGFVPKPVVDQLQRQPRRRRKRDPSTGELLPLSDREDDDSSAMDRSAYQHMQPRRRRKRDPQTGELLPLSDREDERKSAMSVSEDDKSANMSTTSRSKNPLLEFLPQDPSKRPRRRRHPITGELMPLGWRYNPNSEERSYAETTTRVSGSTKNLNNPQEHESKRPRMVPGQQAESLHGRPASNTSDRSPLWEMPTATSKIDMQDWSDSETDKLAVDDAEHQSSAKSTQRTSIFNPQVKSPVKDQLLSSSTSSMEGITLQSFIRPKHSKASSDSFDLDSDSDSDSQGPTIQLSTTSARVKTSIMNPIASQELMSNTKSTPTYLRTSIMNPVATQETMEATGEAEHDDSDDEWFVEAIVAHRISDPMTHPGREVVMLYRTKWEGSDELTWEPFASFIDPETVYEYRRRVGLDKKHNTGLEQTIPVRQPGSIQTRRPGVDISRDSSAAGPSPLLKKAAAPAMVNDGDSDNDSDDSDDGYEVEKILAHHMSDPRTHPGKPQTMLYQVKWVGWKELTWEPVDSFPDRSLVNTYRQKAGLLPL